MIYNIHQDSLVLVLINLGTGVLSILSLVSLLTVAIYTVTCFGGLIQWLSLYPLISLLAAHFLNPP